MEACILFVHLGDDDSPSTNTTNQSSTGSTSANTTTDKSAAAKDKAVSQVSMVKVNLTVEVTVLDLLLPSLARTTLSMEKYVVILL